jgi:tetratricopeptide (TPR) repeat protein
LGVLKHATNICPDEALYWCNLARAHISCSQLKEALESLEKATELWPDHPEAHVILAQLHWKLGNPDQAKKHAQMAFSRNPGDQSIKDLLWALSLDDSPDR